MSEATASVLIVDDVLENIQVVTGHLRGEGYDLLFATDGPSALETLESGGVDLVLLDLMMPGMDGFEVCRRLKANPRTREVPVIFLTAKTDPESLLQGFAMGGVDYITKPFNPPELLARVRTHLRLRRGELALRSLMASKDRFLSIIAEDLRAPFGGLRGMLQMLAREHREIGGEALDEYLQMAAQAADSVSGLLDNLVSWSRLQTGVFGCHPQPLDAGQQAAAVLQLMASELRGKGISATLEAATPVILLADPAMLETALRNLIANAIKFSPRGGAIAVAARQLPEGGLIEVADAGCGIPAAQLDKLFRVDLTFKQSGTEGEKGIGMGLIVARALTEQQGGRLELDSREGQGTRVRLRFPNAPQGGAA
jgi:two-component system, sensor histidine kinase and response regulator